MSDRLPKNLRRREAVEKFTPHAPYWNPVLTADFCKACGEDWPCLPWRKSRALRCKCSHLQHPNGQCWSTACGCAVSRPQEEA